MDRPERTAESYAFMRMYALSSLCPNRALYLGIVWIREPLDYRDSDEAYR